MVRGKTPWGHPPQNKNKTRWCHTFPFFCSFRGLIGFYPNFFFIFPPGWQPGGAVVSLYTRNFRLAASFAVIPAVFSRVLPLPEIERSYAVLAGFSECQGFDISVFLFFLEPFLAHYSSTMPPPTSIARMPSVE